MVQSRLENTNEENDQQYLNLFPSFQAQYNLNEQNALKFTYSHRIDRPKAWRLNLFSDVPDSLNVRRRNPGLQPKFINSLEVGHMLTSNVLNLSSTFFYRRVTGNRIM